MFIKAEDLIKATDQINVIASLDKNPAGILLDIKDDSVEMVYNSAQRAIVRKIPAFVGEDEIKGKIAFDYKRFVDTISTCKPSGILRVGDIEIKLSKNPDNSGKAILTVAKQIVKLDEEGNIIESEIAGKNDYELAWNDFESSTLKQKVLFQPICDNIFETDGADEWDRDELSDVLKNACNGDAKTVYVTSSTNTAFAVNLASSIVTKLSGSISNGFQLSTANAKALVSVLSGVDPADDDKVMVNTIKDGTGKLFACIFFTKDENTAVYSCVNPGSKTDISTITRYNSIKFNSTILTVLTDLIKDSVKAADILSSTPDCCMTLFIDEDGNPCLGIEAENTGASVKNEYKIKCGNFDTTQELGDAMSGERIGVLKFKTNLKTLLGILNANKNGFTSIDFDIDESMNKANVRLGFFDIADAKEVSSNKAMLKKQSKYEELIASGVSEQNALVEAERFMKLTIEEKAELRDLYCGTYYYMQAALVK